MPSRPLPFPRALGVAGEATDAAAATMAPVPVERLCSPSPIAMDSMMSAVLCSSVTVAPCTLPADWPAEITAAAAAAALAAATAAASWRNSILRVRSAAVGAIVEKGGRGGGGGDKSGQANGGGQCRVQATGGLW